MMHFSSFFSLVSSIIFVLYSCRPTTAAALAVSPVKPRAHHWLECHGALPQSIESPFGPGLEMCALRLGYPQNVGCECRGVYLVCGETRQRHMQLLIEWCFSNCECGNPTIVTRNQFTLDLDPTNIRKFDASGNEVLDDVQPHSGNNPTGSTHTCSGTCTSVNHGCKSVSTGDCKCFAPPVSLFYWHQGDCGTRLPFKAKRDLAQQRHSYYLNATAQFASFDKITTPAGPLPDHAAQLASGLLPSPCNASYISFACADSPDGIVHEPPQNWLGALVPEGAKELPPVPKEFLRIHGGKEGKMQVLGPAVD